MYYPFLRGKQYELLAIRELVQKGLISKKVIPIIEPVKETSTFSKTLSVIEQEKKEVYVIINPQVGAFESDLQNKHIHKAILMKDDELSTCLAGLNHEMSRFISIYLHRDDLRNVSVLQEKDIEPEINFISENRYRRNLGIYSDNVGIIRDGFNKQLRNADYKEIDESFFSDDHLYYSKENFKAFSDYSIVGEEYLEAGFAPFAVAIHIVFFDSENVLRIKHFVSNTNDDITDPAGKFHEALEKLMRWTVSLESKNMSSGIEEFKRLFEQKRYPGLGYIKKLSIMHHLEIMENFLESEAKE